MINQGAPPRRLLRSCERRLSTAFVGALSRFETWFGRLWGHGRHREDLSPEELVWREAWEACRNDVLNNGNNQVRALQADVLEFGPEA